MPICSTKRVSPIPRRRVWRNDWRNATSAMLTHPWSTEEQGGMDPMAERGAVLPG